MEIVKSCSTCEHRKGSDCMLSGYHIKDERRYPTVCGTKFEGWVKRLSLIERIKFIIRG